MIIILRVEEVDHLDYVGLATHHVEDFELTGDRTSGFLRSLDSDLALSVLVISREDKSKCAVADYFLRLHFWSLLLLLIRTCGYKRVVIRIGRCTTEPRLFH